MLQHITPVILTYNEESNLARSLQRLKWAREVVIVDSLSQDGTKRIAESYLNVRFIERPFDNHTTQWNFAVDQVLTDWVLSLDADYVLEPGFEQELDALNPVLPPVAYATSFRYCIAGKPLRATLYPPRLVLFRKDRCRFIQDGHTQLLKANGATGTLHSRVLHDDRKPLSHWVWSQDRYARLEAEKLVYTPASQLGFNDRVRKTILLSPLLVFPYVLLLRGGILDGWPGWYYALQRALAETLLSLRLIESRFAPARPNHSNSLTQQLQETTDSRA